MTENTEKRNKENESSMKIGKTAFLGAAGIILVLMVVSGVLTMVLPSGQYERVEKDGRTMIVAESFQEVPKPDYPIWRWFTAPVEVLGAPGNIAVITIILFIVFVSGSIAILEGAGVMKDLVSRLVTHFRQRKYLLMAIMIFLFMFLSSFLGIYEGLVPMIIFIVPLAYSLGWDSLTGLGISLLPLAFGFAAAVTNPFTVAVAQGIAELPLFSGSWLRIIFFLVVYIILYFFVSRYARKVDSKPEVSLVYKEDLEIRALHNMNESAESFEAAHPGMKKALIWFGVCMGTAITFVILTSVIPAISDLSFPLMGLMFLVGGIGAGIFAGISGRRIVKSFINGMIGMIPGIVLILMAYSVKHIIDRGMITDTILNAAAGWIESAPRMGAAFLIYLITLIMNFFIGSASAKAFLMMPILTPLSDLVGITRQTAVLAFDFGDGFSNMLFPSNALLLIALGFTVVSYPRWFRWTFPLQLVMLGITSVFLVFAVLIGFGPF